MKTIVGINLGIRFILEMAMLGVLAYWGYETGEGAMRWLLLVLAPAAAIVLWGLFVSPKAPIELGRAGRVAVEVVVFAAAVLALDSTGHRSWAIAFGVVALVSGTLNQVAQARRFRA